MKIYLASPFFNEKELENVKIAEKILTERGFSPLDLMKSELMKILSSLGGQKKHL